MRILTPSLKDQITGDWARLFPELGRYEPMWLARRVGPLIQGICLEGSSGNSSYLPTTHLHNLCRPFPVIRLTLAQPLLTRRSKTSERIRAALHDELFEDAAARLADASLLPLSGDLSLKGVVSACQAYVGLGQPGSKYPVFLWEDIITLLCWGGLPREAAAALERYEREMRSWPAEVLRQLNGVDAWRKKMADIIANALDLRNIERDQARQLKVLDLPSARLLM